ncbi:NADPH-dependent glutamate synthase [bacterium]|nr:NADPH-dependent glutamate synthase [bacterium]MCG2675698.1 NADPH-dependent glutamate synthase [bacterium]
MRKNLRVRMPRQRPEERIRNFQEVALGYSAEEAREEASRCLECSPAPCKEGCPVEIDIPGFVSSIKEGKFDSALKILWNKNNLPAICGRVCPQETQCEVRCILGKKGEPSAIGRLERFVADWGISQVAGRRSQVAKNNDRRLTISDKPKVAVVGSGPAGLTAAADLSKIGYKITIFESLHLPGGVLRYGIPEFRLPKRVLDFEIEGIKRLGVGIRTNMLVGKIFTLKDLFAQGYKAIFIGTGAGLPRFLNIPGENLNGIYSANEFLTRVNLMKADRFPEYDTPVRKGGRVAVLGAGNVAFDAARVALRLGAEEVTITYRRSEKEMPARQEEIEHAKEEGVKIRLLTLPIRFLGDEEGWVKGMECIRMRLGEPDESGRRRPLPIDGSQFMMKVDTVIVAIGQGPNPLLPSYTPSLKTAPKGHILVDKDGATSIPGVFAGGDIIPGEATVIDAMGHGKRAARAIDAYLKRKK